MCALRREPHFANDPSIREALCNFVKRMCAALKREPYFENDLPSIRETVSTVNVNVRGGRQEPHCDEIGPPSISKPLAH
eukprot:2411649-Pyramimonas_sp.AAC.1